MFCADRRCAVSVRLASVTTMILRKYSFYPMATVLALAFSACSSSDNSTPANDLPGDVNGPPTLSGAPPAYAMPDRIYSFLPQSSDPENDPLEFTISNKPAWATFDGATGRLSGMPAAQHVATYSNIRISANDGTSSVELPAFDIEVLAAATGSLTLSWTPPTQSADGSPLSDLAGYRVRWGTQQGDHPNLLEIDNPGIASLVIDRLAPGSYFMTLSAIDLAGNESTPSNEASAAVQ